MTTTDTLSKRNLALQHLVSARDTGVRGELRDTIQRAIDLIEKPDRSPTQSDYDRLTGGRLTDPTRPGLMMRAGRRSGKQWFLRWEEEGISAKTGKPVRKTKEVKLGDYPAMGIEAAHDAWSLARSRIKQGLPPVDETIPETPVIETLGDLLDKYVSEYSPLKAETSHHHEKLRIARVFGEDVRSMPVDDFNHDAAEAFLVNLSHERGNKEANRVRTILSTAFNAASGRLHKLRLTRTWLPRDYPNPVTGIPVFSVAVEKWKPTTQDLQGYIRGVDQLGAAGPILRLQLETFTRVSEASQMQWSEIDFTEGVWTIPAERSKNKHPHRVMLAGQTLQRLKRWHTERTSNFVFPLQTDPERPVFREYPMQQLSRHRDKLDINPKFTSHKIRHAGLMWLARQRQGKDLRDRLSNHQQRSSVDDDYQLDELDEQARHWTQAWVDYLEFLRSPHGNVIPLRGAADV